MGNILVIGLFKSLLNKYQSACLANGLHGKAVLAEIGRKGTPDLLPIGQDAKHALHAYMESLERYDHGHIVVLPYVDLSSTLMDELNALADLGCTIIHATNGEDGWPLLRRRQKPDTAFLNDVHKRLWQDLPCEEQNNEHCVSEHFRYVLENNKHIRILENVFDTCDAVAPSRRPFLIAALDAIGEFLNSGTPGRIDAFLRGKGLEHAQTGGISTTLTVFAKGHQIHKETSSMHLKKGDRTTAEHAVRLYYQLFRHNGCSYAAILYAGPHPDHDVDGICYIEEALISD